MSVCGFIFIGGIQRFVVLVGVEAMAETDDDLRRQLREAEIEIRDLKTAMAEVLTGGHCSINAHTALGDSDTGSPVFIRS